jgi:hypothetical protein
LSSMATSSSSVTVVRRGRAQPADITAAIPDVLMSSAAGDGRPTAAGRNYSGHAAIALTVRSAASSAPSMCPA